MFSREILQRLNNLHTQVAPAQTDKVGWTRWVIIYPFIENAQIAACINSSAEELHTEEFRLPPLSAGLPSRLSWRLKTEKGWLEPRRCFRVRCFEVEQRIVEESLYGLDGDESFIVDVTNEVTSSLTRVADILSSLVIDSETLDYMGKDFPL